MTSSGIALFPYLGFFGLVTLSVVQYSRSLYHGKLGFCLRWISGLLIAGSSLTFLLILCEIIQAGDHSTRATLWKFCIALLLVLLEFISPAVQIWRILPHRHSMLHNSAAVLAYFLYLIVFRISSKQLPVERYVHKTIIDNSTWFKLRQDSLACISFIGITTMALLCGISSVSAPYTAFVSDKNNVSEIDADRLRNSLRNVREMLQDEQLQISRIQMGFMREKSGSRTGAQQSFDNSGFSLTRLVNLVRSNENQELYNILASHENLSRLESEMESDLECVSQKLQMKQYFRTVKGKIYRAAYTVFAVYCLYNVANSYARLIWLYVSKNRHGNNGRGPRDGIVLFIATYANDVIPELDVEGWSRVIGVFMSGAVFFAALNGALRMCFKVMRLLHKSGAAKTLLRLDLLLASQVAGIYVLSIATTLRLSLPHSMSGPIMSAVISPLKVSSVQLWTDMVMCFTSIVVCVILVIVSRIGSDPIYDLEMGDMKYD